MSAAWRCSLVSLGRPLVKNAGMKNCSLGDMLHCMKLTPAAVKVTHSGERALHNSVTWKA